MKRKSIFILLAYIVGILLHSINWDLYLYLCLFLLAFFCFRLGKSKAFIFFVLIAFASYGRVAIFNLKFPLDLTGQSIRFQATVVNKNYSKNSYKMSIDHINGEKRNLLVSWSGEEVFEIGDRLQGVAQIKLSNPAMNPGDFNYRTYLAANNIFAEIKTRSALEKIGEAGDPLLKIRKFMKAYLYRLPWVRDDFKPFIQSVFTGENTLEEGLYTEIKALGLAHVLAISGLHIGLFFSFFMAFRGYFNKYWLYCWALLTIFLYAFIVDFPPSVKRAMILLTLYYIAETSRQPYEQRTLLATSLLVILLINPYELYSIGLQFSFIATFTIFWKYKTIKKLEGITKAAYISTWIYIMMLPLQAYYFSELSIGFLLGNLFVLPLMILAISLGFLFYLLYPFQIIIAWLINKVMLVLYLVLAGTKNFVFPVEWGRPSLVIIFIYYGAIYFFSNWHQWRQLGPRKTQLMLKMLAYSILLPALLTAGLDPATINFWYIGQGDSALIHYRNSNILVDTGGGWGKGNKNLDHILKNNQVHHLDYVFISHFDEDHVGNLVDIQGKVSTVLSRPGGEEILKEQFGLANISYRPTHHGQSFRLGSMEGEVFHNPTASNENDQSIVLKITLHDVSLLFTGDIEQETERYLRGLDIRSDVLKVGHHGSATSSTTDFIEQVEPKYAIISCGIDNRYGFPKAEVLDRFASYKIPVYRTDTQGCIHLIINRLGYEIRNFSDPYSLREESLALLFAFFLSYIVHYMNKEEGIEGLIS